MDQNDTRTMKQIHPALIVFPIIIVIVQLGYLMVDVHQRRIVEEDQKTQAAIDHEHFLRDQDLLNTKFKVDADFKPLSDKMEELEDLDQKELGKAELHELRQIRIRIERDSEIFELLYKYPHEAR
jgi:hypothetical protein